MAVLAIGVIAVVGYTIRPRESVAPPPLINAGTVQLGDGVANLGAVAGGITNNATLAVANAADQTLVNNLTGSGQLVKNGTAILTLSGANSLAGGTLINTGVVKVAASGALGSAPTTIASGAVLSFDSAANFTQSGVLTGAGSVVKANTDGVTLTASNSFRRLRSMTMVLPRT